MKTRPNTWGYPGNESTIDDWNKYTNIIRNLDKNLLSKIDLVLIDGRFRIACCLKIFEYINNNTFIIFNDFFNRPYYHFILDYYKIVDKSIDNSMVVLQKKNCNKPSNEIIEKYESIKD
jgi:hypothetical protein